jgi:hypothetical protein
VEGANRLAGNTYSIPRYRQGSMDNRTYLIQTANDQYSPPLTLETLVGYARSGAIRPETFVYDQAAAAWIPAHHIPELRSVFSGAAQASIPTFQTATAVTTPRRPMSRGAKAAIVFAIVITVALCGGGGMGMISLIRYGIEESNKPQTFLSKDAAFEITASQSWSTRTDLNDEADLQIANTSDDLYLIVLREPKSDFESDDLEKYSAITRKLMLDTLKNGTESDRKTLTINGHPAIQYQLEGASGFFKFKYLHTSVATSTYFYQILAWGSASDYDSGKEKLEALTSSLKEKPGAVEPDKAAK